MEDEAVMDKSAKFLGGMYDGLVMDVPADWDYTIHSLDPRLNDKDFFVSYVRSGKKDEDGNELFEYQGGRTK